MFIISVTLYRLFYAWNPLYEVKYENIKNNKTALLQWEQKMSDTAENIFSLCAPLNGCRMTTGENLCASHLQMCLGAPRCCGECVMQKLYNETKSVLISKADTIIDKKSFSSITPITFKDSHQRVIHVNLLVSVKILVAHIMIACLMGLVDQNKSGERITHTNNFEDLLNKYIPKTTILKRFMFILLFWDLVACIIVMTYTAVYFIDHFNMLLKCQTIFALLLSWLGIYALHILDHLVVILPNLRTLHYMVLLMKSCSLSFIKGKYPTCISPEKNFNHALSIIYTSSLIWWVIFISVFLTVPMKKYY